MLNTLIVNVVFIAAIALIIWWFWLSKVKLIPSAQNKVTIYVKDGVYTPARIGLTAGKPITLNFIRQSTSPCSEYVVFATPDVHEKLPLNKTHAIEMDALSPGEYPFGCQMNMYQGVLDVR
jgi:plastocyanin domain-containing protein